MGNVRLRTAAWYGDVPLDICMPGSWDVTEYRPRTGPALSDAQVAERLASPVGQPSIREVARGRRRVMIVVDDLNRPTPAARVMPSLLAQLRDAGVSPREVTVVMAPGTHGSPRPDAMSRKIGDEAAAACRVLVHDPDRDLVSLGRTSFGTRVMVNRQIAESDLLIGVGGVYPNWTAGFGGGSKLALGVLGFETIAALHLGHQGMGWGTSDPSSNFRRDLDEIAQMIGLNTAVAVVVDADREIVAAFCGDTWLAHASAEKLVREAFCAPRPGDDVDVVVANAYPNDLSLTFVRMKGMQPVSAVSPRTSKVVIAACSEGIGFHGLCPMANASRAHRRRLRALKARILLRRPRRLATKVMRRVSRRGSGPPSAYDRKPTWLYRPARDDAAPLSTHVPTEINVTSSWDDVVAAVQSEQGDRRLRVAVYPCAPLQWLA